MGDFFKWLFELINEGIKAGIPVDVIIIAVLIVVAVAGAYLVIRYMMRSKKEILKGQTDVVNTLTKVNSSLTTLDDALKEQVNILSNITFRLEVLEGNSGNISELQALTFGELLVEESFGSMLRVYFDTREWLDSKKPLDPSEDDSLNARTIDRVTTSFEVIQRDYINKLGIYSINNKSLDAYINDRFRNEWNHIMNEITNRLIIDQNSIKEYLKDKQEIFKSDLFQYIRSL